LRYAVGSEMIHRQEGELPDDDKAPTARASRVGNCRMATISAERERLPHWQHVRKLILEEPNVATISWQFRLAVLKDATKL
jgi:hypothetical protein